MHSDIVVVGGGMVGALTALAMARCDFRVTVIEQRPPSEFSLNDHDLRVSAISHATLQMFKAVGVWDTMQSLRVCPYKRMLVWDNATSAETWFDSSHVGYKQLGFIVENSLMQHVLWQELRALPNVSVRTPATVVDLSVQADKALLTLDADNNSDTLSASLVVAADGFNSTVRSLAKINVDGERYDQHALVATVKTELAQQDITWQRFTESGPQAFLPLAGNRASMVWYHSAERIAELKALSDADFISAMQSEFPERLGGLLQVERRGSFPLQWSHAQQYVKPGIALVGDAAHAVHPLAGQGVNLGMLDAAVLVQCVVDGLAEGRAIGSLRTLRRYERWRKPANASMIKMLDTIQRAFQPEGQSALHASVLKTARTAALYVGNNITPINKVCIRTAMGLTGELPALARGSLPVSSISVPD